MKVLNTFVQSILEETVRKSESKQGHEEKNEKEEGEALLEVWSNVPKVDIYSVIGCRLTEAWAVQTQMSSVTKFLMS